MRKLLLLPCLFISQALLANEPIWTDVEEDYQYRQSNTAADSNHRERHLKLDLSKLSQRLATAATQSNEEKYLHLPLPNGQQVKFKVEATSVMAKELAQRYPQIRTWKISSPDNPSVSGRIDLTPKGFHGLINTQDGKRVFIDPNTDSGSDRYVSRHSHIESGEKDSFSCQLHGESPLLPVQSSIERTGRRQASRPADSFRTYRIAVAATGE